MARLRRCFHQQQTKQQESYPFREEKALHPVSAPTNQGKQSLTESRSMTARQEQQQQRDVIWLLRHGERVDHCDPSWRGKLLKQLLQEEQQLESRRQEVGKGGGGITVPSTDPPLSRLGRIQALETGLYFRQLRIQSEKTSTAPTMQVVVSVVLHLLRNVQL